MKERRYFCRFSRFSGWHGTTVLVVSGRIIGTFLYSATARLRSEASPLHTFSLRVVSTDCTFFRTLIRMDTAGSACRTPERTVRQRWRGDPEHSAQVRLSRRALLACLLRCACGCCLCSSSFYMQGSAVECAAGSADAPITHLRLLHRAEGSTQTRWGCRRSVVTQHILRDSRSLNDGRGRAWAISTRLFATRHFNLRELRHCCAFCAHSPPGGGECSPPFILSLGVTVLSRCVALGCLVLACGWWCGPLVRSLLE